MALAFASSVEKPLTFTWHFDGGEYGFTGEQLGAERVTELTREILESVPRKFERKMNLEPLGVVAIVVK